MSVLSNEQVKQFVNLAIGEEPVNKLDFFDQMVSESCPEWPSMDKDEKDCYYYGFLNGYKAAVQISQFVLNTKRSEEGNENRAD